MFICYVALIYITAGCAVQDMPGGDDMVVGKRFEQNGHSWFIYKMGINDGFEYHILHHPCCKCDVNKMEEMDALIIN